MLTYQLLGVPQLIGRLTPDRLLAKPITNLLNRWAITVESGAKRGAPVDTGRLRASVTHRLDARAVPLFAEVGTNVQYAPWVHGPLDGSSGFSRRPGAKMPPGAALVGWARRHGGIPVFVLARAISRRGIKAKPFLRNAAEAARGQISGWVATAAREIEAAFKGGR